MTTNDRPADTFAPEGFDDYRFDADDEGPPPGPDTRMFERHRVTAVLVAHNGQRWLPRTLAAIAALGRAPERVIAVDTGSTDRTPALLNAALGPAAVLTEPAETGFGAAVRHAVDAREGAPGLPSASPGEAADLDHIEWLWLLHDDCAPEPESLRRLLAAVDASPSIGIAGPKVRGWSEPSLLLEVGLTAGGGGRRETGLERREIDQGQRDDRRDVLAVGSAGLLIRRDVWDQLDGFDPRLVMFRDDLDLGWRANLAGHRVCVVPDAVVHHAEAASRGRRTPQAAGGRAHRADRRSALHVLLANAPWYAVPWHGLRLGVGSALRTLGLLLSKAPGEALDEIAAMSVLVNLGALARARRARRPLRKVSPGSVRRLLAPPLSGVRHTFEWANGLLAGRIDLSASVGSAMESGPTGEDEDSLTAGPSRFGSLARRPGFLLFLGLTVVSLVAFRGLVTDAGQLLGGMLLPAPDGAGAMWASYTSGWHDVGVGSSISAPAYLVPLAALSTVLLAKTWLAVTLILTLAIPLAGLSAYLVLGRLSLGRTQRVLGALAYAVLPAVSGAVATGRLGTVVAAILLPPAGWLAASAVGLTKRPGSVRRALAAGLLLAVVVAFVPVTWALAAVAGLVGTALLAPRSPGGWLRLLVALAVPPLVLFPWTLRALSDPSTLLLEAGAPQPGLADPALPAWHVAVANPGGPGVPSAWFTVGLLLAALAALLSSRRRRTILAGWAVALTGLLTGLVLAHQQVTPPSLGTPIVVWPGVSSLLVGGGLIAAATVAGEDLQSRLRAYGFGWRQPIALVIAATAVAAPVLLAASWLSGGVAGPLHRSDADVVPAYVSAAGATAGKPRALVVRRDAPELATYTVVQGSGPVVGDAEVEPPVDRTSGLESALARLLAGQGDNATVAQVRSYGIGYLVLLDPDVDQQQTLDGVGALQRVSSVDGTTVWRLSPAVSRVRLTRPGKTDLPVPADPDQPTTSVDARVPGSPGGMVALAESADPGWSASVDGQALTVTAAGGWAESFAASDSGGRLLVWYSSNRSLLLTVQVGLLFLIVLLALPTRRRTEPDDEPDEPTDAGVGATP